MLPGRINRRIAALFLCVALGGASIADAAPLENASPLTLTTPSYVLMEAETGQVIFEKDADARRPVASVTKLMTILLTLEALDAGTVRLQDTVVASKAAAGMGGSQALLDANARYPLEDLLKSMIVASANDSAVALAEHLAGTEEAFAQRMNARAAELSLQNTHFVNCTGLPADGHYTCARDVAELSRAVATHPTFFQYSTIWLDTLTHPGGRKTDLTNTNRLIRFYEGCDGFKTGSTNEAKYCISATNKRGDTRMIAVVLGTPVSQTRFDEARAMLEYGLANYTLARPAQKGDRLGQQVAVRHGARDAAEVAVGADIALLVRRGQEKEIRFEVALPERVDAPLQTGDAVGEVRVMLGDAVMGVVPAVAAQDVGLPGFIEGLLRIRQEWNVSGTATDAR